MLENMSVMQSHLLSHIWAMKMVIELKNIVIKENIFQRLV